MFRRAKNTAVFGGTFTEVYEGLSGRQILSQSRYVVHDAMHDSGQQYPVSECHPGTREDILNMALGWVDKPLDESESQIFWLSGPAGVGKTAIAQSLCQRLRELGRLGGDFFLSRSIAGHSNLRTLFPTLAYQVAHAYPEFGLDLDNVIKTDESILTKNIQLQLEQLIINPLKRVNSKLDIPLVLVIDGLDEAGGESDQISFLRLLGSTFLSHHLPLKVFLTSRPEPWIKTAFGDNPLLCSSRYHFLHRTSQTDNDIRNVIKSKFAEIRRTHDLMKSRSDSWPPFGVIDDIVDRASGQFIYVATVLRYIEDPNWNPVDRLQWIMEMPSIGHHEFVDSPFLALDNLYKHVLLTSSNIGRTLIILGTAISSVATHTRIGIDLTKLTVRLGLRITIAALMYGSPLPPPYFNFPIECMERILNLGVGDGFLALRTVQSLVDVSSDGKGSVRFYHKSFLDFLLDRNRSGEYFVDMNQVHSKLMEGAFRLVKEFEQSETGSKRKEMYLDLEVIDREWVTWWLCSAASDQNRLLKGIKAIDQAGFYRNYAGNFARKVPLLLFKAYPRRMDSLVEPHRSSGNVAESMSLEIERRTILNLSLERFRVVETIFGKHLDQALRTKFENVGARPALVASTARLLHPRRQLSNNSGTNLSDL